MVSLLPPRPKTKQDEADEKDAYGSRRRRLMREKTQEDGEND